MNYLPIQNNPAKLNKLLTDFREIHKIPDFFNTYK